MKNERNPAELEIEIGEKKLRLLIIGVANDMARITVFDCSFTANTRRQRLKKRDTELVLNNGDLSNVIAHDMISNFLTMMQHILA